MRNLLIIGLFFFSLLANAQEKRVECGTKTPKNARVIAKEDMQRFMRTNAVSEPYCVKAYFTVFADNDGSNRATTDEHVLRQFQNMVNQYAPQDICFTLIGIRQINNSDWNVQEANNEESEMYNLRLSGCLNIFIHKELYLDGKRLNGIAYDIPNTDAFISLVGSNTESSTNLTTMAHEVGHVFGLFHTFEIHP